MFDRVHARYEQMFGSESRDEGRAGTVRQTENGPTGLWYLTKATPTISALQLETKRARELFGLTPEKATAARRDGAISYVSAEQRERNVHRLSRPDAAAAAHVAPVAKYRGGGGVDGRDNIAISGKAGERG